MALMQRITLGKMQNPVRGFLHGTAAIASLAGLVALLALNPGGLSTGVALAVYAGSLVALYTTSSLYHSVPWSDTWKRRMQKLDHANIFLVVAGTFTPFAVVALEGAWRSASLIAVWTAAVVGIVLKLVQKHEGLGVSVTIQQIMGWSAVIPMWQIGNRLGVSAVVLIAVGGVLYTTGMVFMLTGWPKLFPRVFSSHELFHVMVVAASTVHFVAILTTVLPNAA
jgi:hemolysin III